MLRRFVKTSHGLAQSRAFTANFNKYSFEERTGEDGYKVIAATVVNDQPIALMKHQIIQNGLKRRFNQIFLSKDEKEDDKKDAPKGFEKFLKKTREGKKAADKKEDKGDKGDKKAQKDDEDEQTEEETVEEEKKQKQESQVDEAKKKINQFFFEPNGKGPKWENFALVAFLTSAFGYYLATMSSPSEEVTYIDFINQYLAQNQCTMITISEDKSSDMFKYRAQIDTVDGKRIHLVLPQVENFLYKLDLAQREMGKSP